MAGLHKKLCEFMWDLNNNPELKSLVPQPDDPTAIQYTIYLLSILTCFIGLGGNAVVIIITAFFMKNYKSKIWFLNLAVADFTFVLFLPLHAVSVLKAEWPFGMLMCKSYHYFTFVNMYASIYVLTALNIDRALSIVNPIWHMKFLSKKICYSVCALIWITSALASVPAFMYSDVFDHGTSEHCALFSNDIGNVAFINSDTNFTGTETLKNSSQDVCQGIPEDEDSDLIWKEMFSLTSSLIISLNLIGYLIPLCIILLTNLAIAIKVKKSQSGPSSRLYRVVVVTIMAFFCSRTPLVLGQIILLASAYAMEFTLLFKVTMFLPLLSSLASANSCLNPIIYVLIGNQIRTLICSLLKKR